MTYQTANQGNDAGTPRYFYGQPAHDTNNDYSLPIPTSLHDAEWGPAWRFASAASLKGNFFEHFAGGPGVLPESCNTATMSVWFTADALGAYRAICGHRQGSNQFLLFASGAVGNPLTFAWNNTPAEYDAASGLTLTIGRRYFGCCVITPTNATVATWDAVEGWRQFDLAATYNPGTSFGSNFVIGGDALGGPGSATAARAWDGLIAEVRVYDRAIAIGNLQRMAAVERLDLYAATRRYVGRRRSTVAAASGRPFFTTLTGQRL